MSKKRIWILVIVSILLMICFGSIIVNFFSQSEYPAPEECRGNKFLYKPDYYYQLGIHYKFYGHDDPSEECVNKAILLNPNYKEAYILRAQLSSSRSIEEKFADFDKAIEIDPNYIEAYFERGKFKCSYEIKAYKGAIKDFDKAILLTENKLKEQKKEKEDTTYSRADLQKFYEKRAYLKNLLKDSVGFVSDYNKAINILSSFIDDRMNESKTNRENMIETYSNLSRLYIERKELKEEIQDYKGAVNDLKKALYYCNLETKKSNQNCEKIEIDIAQLAKK